MKFRPTPIAGAFVIEIEAATDMRGIYAHTYSAAEFAAAGVPFGTVRLTSFSYNVRRGTMRGTHWQAEKPEAKLVRVVAGRVFDVILDLRPESPTYRSWHGVELNASQHDTLLVPPFCGHALLSLEPNSIISYAMDADADPALQRGARWDDPAFNIAWPEVPEVVTERDRTWPAFPG
jgi:dTDP-4-dehydrorhamnose 3,5-epimerase